MPGTLQPITVGIRPQRIQTWLAPNESFLLVNNDITNQIFIGNDPGVQSIPVPPLGSVTLGDSKKDIWISTGGIAITVQAFLFPSGTQWTPSPAQVAAQINALGLAKDTTVAGVNTSISLGTTPAVQQLGGVAGRSVAQDMLNANKGVTTEVSALIATGNAGGTPGGVPLRRDTKTLASQTTEVTILAGHVQNIVNFAPTNQPAYEMSFTVRFPANAGTIPFADLIIEWFDQASGIAIDIFECVVAGGNNQQIFFNLYGPNRGDEIFIQVTNLDPIQSMFMTWVVNATSHVYERDRLIQPGYQSSPPNGFQNPAGNVTSGILAASNPSIGPNASTTRLIAAYNGLVDLLIDDGAQANDVVVTLGDPGTLFSTIGNAPVYKNRITAGQRAFVDDLKMPNGNALLTIANGAGVNTIVPTIVIARKEY